KPDRYTLGSARTIEHAMPLLEATGLCRGSTCVVVGDLGGRPDVIVVRRLCRAELSACPPGGKLDRRAIMDAGRVIWPARDESSVSSSKSVLIRRETSSRVRE